MEDLARHARPQMNESHSEFHIDKLRHMANIVTRMTHGADGRLELATRVEQPQLVHVHPEIALLQLRSVAHDPRVIQRFFRRQSLRLPCQIIAVAQLVRISKVGKRITLRVFVGLF